MGVNRDGPSEDLGLVYEVDDTVRNSLVTLEVSADDMILIYNRLVFGEWSEVAVDGYVALLEACPAPEGGGQGGISPARPKKGGPASLCTCTMVFSQNLGWERGSDTPYPFRSL